MTTLYRPNRWSLTVSVAPTAEPITVADLKDMARIQTSDEEYSLSGIVTAARQAVENATRRALMTQTRVLKLDAFPAGDQYFELPGGNIQSVTSIIYNDTDNATQTLSSAVYETDFGTDGGTGRIGLAPDQEWPDLGDSGLNVTVTYVAGWTSAALVPQSLKHAIALMASWLYDNRAAFDMSKAEANPAFDALIAPYRIHRVS